MVRGFKASTLFHRGKKFVAGVVKRGVKFVAHLPQHLHTLDEAGRKAGHALDNASQLLGTAGEEFGNQRLIEAGNKMYEHGTSLHNVRHGNTAQLVRNMAQGNNSTYWTPH